MNPHRILFLAPSLEGKGGVVEFCRMLVSNLGPDFAADHLTIANRPGVRNPLRRVGHFCGDYIQLGKKLKGARYSLVHVNPSFRSLALLRDGMFIRRIHRHFPGRILVTFHGWDRRLLERIRKNFLLRALLKNTIGKASMILVLSETFKSQLETLGFSPDRIKAITTMYQGDFADRNDEVEDATGSKTNLVFLSRFIRCKGTHVAAEAVKILVEQGHSNIYATIAGDGPEREGIRDFIRKNRLEGFIGMTGFIEGEEKKKILEQGDIFLFPTYCQEGCPIVLLEAMGAGMAVVSTPMGAIPDIVANGKNGFLVEGQNPQDFAEKIRDLLEDRPLLRKFKIQNQEEAKNKYTASVVTRRIELFYCKLMGESPSM
jgi:glycosyltransferase involved in cell wall biosynthesis